MTTLMRSPRRYFAASLRRVTRSDAGLGPPYTDCSGLCDNSRGRGWVRGTDASARGAADQAREGSSEARRARREAARLSAIAMGTRGRCEPTGHGAHSPGSASGREERREEGRHNRGRRSGTTARNSTRGCLVEVFEDVRGRFGRRDNMSYDGGRKNVTAKPCGTFVQHSTVQVPVWVSSLVFPSLKSTVV